jgi:hypothetical protein
MNSTSPSLRKSILVLAVALAASGCGGGERSAETTAPPRPTLPRPLAEDLAARSDAIADALDAGDVCTAAGRADELLDATTTAINNGQVPREFQEDLQARANELVNTVNCPPPPTTTEEEENGDGKGRGKKKEKSGEDGSNEENTVTVPTETVPTGTVPTVTGVIP